MDEIEPMASNYALASFVFQQNHHGNDDHNNTSRYVDCIGDEESLMFPMTSSSASRSLLGFDLIASRCVDRTTVDAVAAAASSFSEPEYCHLDYATDASTTIPSMAAESCHRDVIGISSCSPLMTNTATTTIIDDRYVYMTSKNVGDDDVSVANDRFQQRHLGTTHWTAPTPPFVVQSHHVSAATSAPTTTERMHQQLNPPAPSRSTVPVDPMLAVSAVGRADTAGRCSIPSTFNKELPMDSQVRHQPSKSDNSEVSSSRMLIKYLDIYDNYLFIKNKYLAAIIVLSGLQARMIDD